MIDAPRIDGPLPETGIFGVGCASEIPQVQLVCVVQDGFLHAPPIHTKPPVQSEFNVQDVLQPVGGRCGVGVGVGVAVGVGVTVPVGVGVAVGVGVRVGVGVGVEVTVLVGVGTDVLPQLESAWQIVGDMPAGVHTPSLIHVPLIVQKYGLVHTPVN